MVLAFLPRSSRADFTYGGTQLSWEWLTDASRAIVIGPVEQVDGDGRFTLRVERVLKRRGVAIAPGQTVTGPVLGRSGASFGAPLAREIGWPSLANPDTYPAARTLLDLNWRPHFFPEKDWRVGDRYLVFYSSDLDAPLQVINLDHPVRIEVWLFAPDLAGQPVAKADELVQQIAARVARSRDEQGRAMVATAGINYWPPKNPLDGADYYYVLAPPDPELAELWSPEILKEPSKLETDVTWYPSGEDLGSKAMAPQAVWYWNFSGLTEEDYRRHAQQELDAAVKSLRPKHVERDEDGRRYYSADAPRSGISDYDRNQGYRSHRVNYRTYPLGWQCVLSYDQNYIAIVDGSTLQVHRVGPRGRTTDGVVFESHDAHRALTQVEFSWDGRLMAYNTRRGALCLVDLSDGKILWRKAHLLPLAATASNELRALYTARMEFSPDQKYLVQQVKRISPPRAAETPNVWGRDQGGQAVHVWEVATGRHVFSPYAEWRVDLKYISFHPDDSRLLRLAKPARDGLIRLVDFHEIWDVEAQRRLDQVSRKTTWESWTGRQANATR